MSAVCYKCQRWLPNNWTIRQGEPPPDDSWHMKNVAPDAAGGGVMMPICYKCDPSPLIVVATQDVSLISRLGRDEMIEITVGLCESFKAIGIDISEVDLRKFEQALYEHGLNVTPRATSEPIGDASGSYMGTGSAHWNPNLSGR